MQKMNKSIKKRWVNALRSGKYEQTTGVLTDGDGKYCFLGVLCKTIESKLPDVEILLYSGYGTLDDDTLEFCQLTEDIQNKLIDFNDKSGWSFKKIAYYIDRYL